jgi:hypothetical protein
MGSRQITITRPETDPRSPWPIVVALAAALLLVRLAYLAWLCPYTLAEDEAHYWDWSRNCSTGRTTARAPAWRG